MLLELLQRWKASWLVGQMSGKSLVNIHPFPAFQILVLFCHLSVHLDKKPGNQFERSSSLSHSSPSFVPLNFCVALQVRSRPYYCSSSLCDSSELSAAALTQFSRPSLPLTLGSFFLLFLDLQLQICQDLLGLLTDPRLCQAVLPTIFPPCSYNYLQRPFISFTCPMPMHSTRFISSRNPSGNASSDLQTSVL